MTIGEFGMDISRMIDGERVTIMCEVPMAVPEGYGAVTGSVRIKGHLTRAAKTYRLVAEAEAEVQMVCARCAQPVVLALAFAIEEIFCEAPADEDIWPVAEHRIDWVPAVTDNLLAQLPIKALCAEDCKGLCRVCGADWNKGSCDCQQEAGDERFAVLKQWFSEDDTDTI